MKKYWIPVLLISLFIAGCSSPDQAPVIPTVSEVSDLSESPVPTTAIPIPTETPVPVVVHQSIPGEFVITPLQRIYDCTTGQRAAAAEVLTLSETCDQWEINYFERPVNQEIGDYSPQLDIARSEFGQDENWYYARIYTFTEGYSDFDLDGIYSIELDLNLDARGDVLITSMSPSMNPEGEWSVEGVTVWLDSNDDVGGPQAMQVDQGYEGDGYEELVFDSGMGEDPDLAWVKTSIESPGLIEFAFKPTLIPGGNAFEWWMWAMKNDLGADKYDPVDFYQVDSIYYMDNTCGWIFGDSPVDLPNLCNSISNSEVEEGPSCPPPKFDCAAAGGDWHGYPDCFCEIN